MSTLTTTSPANITLPQSVSRHLGGVAINGSLGASIAALALAAIVVLVGVFGMLASVFGGSIREGQPKDVIDKLVASHTVKIDEYEKRFNGRSIFYKPPMPPPNPTPHKEGPPPPPPPPPAPTTPPQYGGPSIAWVIGDDVYFAAITPTQTEKYLRIRVGEERSGLKVIALDKMPRTVRVGYQGGEYDVKVFGESTMPESLFPTTPRTSAFVPGFIAEGQPPASMPVQNIVTGEEPTPEAIAPDSGDNKPSPRGGPRHSGQNPRGGRAPRDQRPAPATPDKENPKGREAQTKEQPYEPKPVTDDPKTR